MTTTATNTTPSTLPYWAGAIALVALIGAMQTLDGDSEHTTALKIAQEVASQRSHTLNANREWLARRDVCHRAYGPQTVPTETANGHYTCTDARGRNAPPAAMPNASTTLAQANKGGAL